MMKTPLTTGVPDLATLRHASLKVALRISAACAVLVLGLLAAATAYLVDKLAHPGLPGSAAGKAYTYLDSKDLIEAMIITGAGGILLAGLIGWLSARSAIRPLGEALALQRRFVQDASHELRTPLTILDTRIQLAQRKAVPYSEAAQALAGIREDTAALTGIVHELLLAATGSTPSPTAEPVALAEIAESATESLQELAAQQGIRLSFTASDLPRTHRPELPAPGRARSGRQRPRPHTSWREHQHQHNHRGQPRAHPGVRHRIRHYRRGSGPDL